MFRSVRALPALRRVSDDGPSRRCGLQGGRRPKASSEGTRVRLGRTAAAGYGDLISRLWVCGSRRGSVLTLLCPQVRLIGCDWVALTMRFGDARGAECNAGHVFGRAAASLVGDQRGKPLVARVRTVAVS